MVFKPTPVVLKNLVLLLLSGLYSSLVIAQIKDSCVFLKGNYLEAGVNLNGAYGSHTDAPGGYHARPDPTVMDKRLGFVIDPAKDGWLDSTAPARAYYGDMFLPGTPQEGWSILANTRQANCWNIDYDRLPAGVTGYNSKLITAGSRIAATWEGTFDSLYVEQRTVLDTANTYLTIRVKIRNMANKPRTNVHYLRTIDPDNEVMVVTPFYDGFSTHNKIDWQLPNVKNASMVSARGNRHEDAFVSMVSRDDRARCFINKTGLMPSSRLDTLYAKDTALYLYGMGDTLYNDVAISMVFKIDTLKPLDSTLIVMAYIFAAGDIDSALMDEGWMPGDPLPPAPVSVTGSQPTVPELKIAPNPFDGQLQVKGLKVSDRVVLYDLNGRMVQRWIAPADGDHTWAVNEMPAGVYLLQVQDQYGQLKAKLPVQHR